MPESVMAGQPAFLAWAAAGFGAEIIRVRPADFDGDSPGKRPIDDAWPSLIVTPEMLSAWSGQHVNVGLRTAHFPTVDIDVDDEDVAEAIERVIVAVFGQGARRTRSNSARRALIYRLAGPTFKKKAIKFQLPSGVFAKVEILADGQQVVVAGLHPSGVPNEFLEGQPLASKLPTISGSQEDEILSLLRVRLAALGCTLNDRPAPPPPVIRRTIEPVGDKMRRAAAYVARMGPSVEGQGGDDHAFRVACTLARDFDLSEDEAWSELCNWSATCLPPWPDADLRRFLRSALKNGTHTPGAKLREGRPYTPPAPAWTEVQGEEPDMDPEDCGSVADVLAEARAVAKDKTPAERHASTPPQAKQETPPATPGEMLGLGPRPCSTESLRERQELRFISMAELPERHGWGEFLDKLTGGGLAPGSIVGLGAAGTGAGKTAFMMQLLDGLAMRSSFSAERDENTAPLTPIIVLSEMAAVDLEARTLGRLVEVPGQVFLAGRSAKRWHKWSWVDEKYDTAAKLMQPGALFSRIAEWQRVARPHVFGHALVQCIEAYIDAWVSEIRARYPGHDIVPIVAVDPINRFVPTDGRSEVETLGELASDLDALADRRRWIVLVTADTNKTAARDPSQAATGAAVFRGTMQLLHAFDLTLVLEPGDSDADGVRDYGVRLDKNRYGRADVGLNFRWHTRTGLRFIPETEDEWKERSGERVRPDDTEARLRLVSQIAGLVSAGVRVTRRSIVGRAKEYGLTRDGFLSLVDSGVVHGELTEERAGRGGGMVLVPTGKGLPSGGANEPSELSRELSRVNCPEGSAQFGAVAQLSAIPGNDSGSNCPGELSRGTPKTVTGSEPDEGNYGK